MNNNKLHTKSRKDPAKTTNETSGRVRPELQFHDRYMTTVMTQYK